MNSDIISSLGDSLDVLKMKNTKTFQNFDFSELSGKGLEKLKSITPLAPRYAHRNLAFIGPAGTGKTHLQFAVHLLSCLRFLQNDFQVQGSVAKATIHSDYMVCM